MSWILVKSRSSIVYRSLDNKTTQKKYTVESFLNDLTALENKVGDKCPDEKKTELYNIVHDIQPSDLNQQPTELPQSADLINPAQTISNFYVHNFPAGTIIPDLILRSNDPDQISKIMELGVIAYQKLIEIAQNDSNNSLQNERSKHASDLSDLRESLSANFAAKESQLNDLIADLRSQIANQQSEFANFRSKTFKEYEQRLLNDISVREDEFNTQLAMKDSMIKALRDSLVADFAAKEKNLIDQITDLRSDLANQQKLFDQRLQNDLDSKNSQIADLIARKDQELQSVREALIATYSSKENHLTTEINDLRDQIAKQLQDFSNFRTNIYKEYEQRIKDSVSAKENDLNSLIQKKDADLISVSQQLSDLRKIYDHDLSAKYNEGSQQAIAASKDKLDFLSQRLNALQCENETLRSNLNAQNDLFHSQKSKIYNDALEQSAATFQDKFDLLVQQIDDLKKEKDDLKNEKTLLLNRIDTDNKLRLNSSNLGKEGEINLENLLLTTFPDCSFIKYEHGHVGDLVQRFKSINILWEAKNHATRTKNKDCEKFLADIRSNPEINIGIMVAIHAVIDGHNSNSGFEIVPLENNKYAIFLSQFNKHSEPAFILRILSVLFDNIASGKNDASQFAVFRSKLHAVFSLAQNHLKLWKKQKHDFIAFSIANDAFFTQLIDFLGGYSSLDEHDSMAV
jgi:hypothetical protein